jgi:hypothetical protein
MSELSRESERVKPNEGLSEPYTSNYPLNNLGNTFQRSSAPERKLLRELNSSPKASPSDLRTFNDRLMTVLG